MTIFFMRTVIIILLIFSSSASFAIDCTNTINDVEKIICVDQNLITADKDFNELYNAKIKTLLKRDRIFLQNLVTELLNARNECINVYGLSLPLQKKIDTSVDSNEEHELYLEHYQLGCLATWYYSITSAIELNSDIPRLFQIPSYIQYVELFKTLKNNLPFIFEISELDEAMYKLCKQENPNNTDHDCTNNKNIRIRHLLYFLYFPKNTTPFFSQKTHFWFYNAGAAHGHSSSSLEYIANAKIKLLPISQNSYSCSVPIQEPIVINNNIYLPENVGLTSILNKFLGEYNESNCYACSGIYKPDCLLRFKKLDNIDSYLVFTNDYLDYGQDSELNNYFDQHPVRYDIKCVQDIVMKYADDIKEHKNKCMGGVRRNDNQYECIFVKESNLQIIKEDIKTKCLNITSISN